MIAKLPCDADLVVAAEVLDEVASDALCVDSVRDAAREVAAFLPSLHHAKCVACGAPIGSLSQWAEQLERNAVDARVSSVAHRTVQLDISRRMRGYCSAGCADGTVRDGY